MLAGAFSALRIPWLFGLIIKVEIDSLSTVEFAIATTSNLILARSKEKRIIRQGHSDCSKTSYTTCLIRVLLINTINLSVRGSMLAC